MKQTILILILLALLAACAPPAVDTPAATSPLPAHSPGEITLMKVFRSPSCGCCEGWIANMKENGFVVRVEDAPEMTVVKNQYKVPLTLQSCHTATVDGYIIEGHVPMTEIKRLLHERPDVAGLAVPGMPIGSPGMEQPGTADQAYDVLTFDRNGNTAVYASYGQ